MNYEIQSKNDFLTGAYLVAKIPESELDRHALYTIQTDCPDFIIPFHYKSSDGFIELVYKIGTHCKLQYFSGDMTPEEYVHLWQSIISPLLECGDWFMNPCSFLMSADYLYYDKNKKSISYIYIPSVFGCSGHDTFYEMAVELSKLMTVTDAVLENKVLKAIIKDFNPLEFLQMLKEHVTQSASYSERTLSPETIDKNDISEISMVAEKVEPYKQAPVENDSLGELIIDIQENGRQKPKKKERDSGGYKLFSKRSQKKKTLPEILLENDFSVSNEPASASASQYISSSDNDMKIKGVTESVSAILDGPGLRCVGNAALPPSIQVRLSEMEVFTIGRFDAEVGKKQSSFEFDKKTKAISRRHAVIERNLGGYKIIDLSSSAGTFVNDKKIPPNTPYNLEEGFKVSFGNCGADYVWEVS